MFYNLNIFFKLMSLSAKIFVLKQIHFIQDSMMKVRNVKTTVFIIIIIIIVLLNLYYHFFNEFNVPFVNKIVNY